MEVLHRYFVQYMLKKGCTTVKDAIEFCNLISKGNIMHFHQFKLLVSEINKEISKQCFKIVLSVCEVTDKDMVLWTNNKNDDISKLQLAFSNIELEYFHVIFKEILQSEELRLAFIVCVNLTSTLTATFFRENGQKDLDLWLKGGYFSAKDGYIHIGPRTIVEFTSYLRAQCPDSVCKLCSELVFTGQRCGHCDKVIHSYCLSKFLDTQNKCPCCKKPWTEASNLTQTQDEYNESELSQPSTSQTRRKRKIT